MQQRRVALVIERQVGYREQVLRGIWRYVSSTRRWTCRGMDLRPEAVPGIRAFDPHGLIVGLWNPGPAAEVAKIDRPMVDVFDWMPQIELPRVGIADRLVGRMAADHLLERGLRHVGFVGPDIRFALLRLSGFQERLAEEGVTARVYSLAFDETWLSDSWISTSATLRDFLLTLPRPCGVFAANDHLGACTIETCRDLGLRVPDDVAVLGVDNDEFMCTLIAPPLSSISVDAERVGYEAAVMLDRLLDGEPAPTRPTLIPPIGVVARPSTDILATEDAQIAAALRFIRARALRRITVADILREVPMRRRTFERRFVEVVGHGVVEEVRRVRLEAARHLLAETDLPMPQVATRSGFPNARQFSRVFRQVTGATPTRYRRQFGFRA